MDKVLPVHLAGHTLIARGDRTLFWPDRRTLFVADVHLGKAQAFRASGVPMPSGTTEATLGRLSDALHETDPVRLVMLGDLWHAKAGRSPGTMGKFLTWRDRHRDVQIDLIVGNHDVRSGALPADARVVELPDPWLELPFALRHVPEPDTRGYVLAGHLHPGAVLQAKRHQIVLPCFWFGPQVGVLPAFGDFTGNAPIRARGHDFVFAVADGHLVSVGAERPPAELPELGPC